MSDTHFQLDDTIGALASAAGAGARGIVRISGPRAIGCLEDWFEPHDANSWRGLRVASCHVGRLRLNPSPQALDVLVYAWPTMRSYTAQPLVEIHAPGSPPLLDALASQVFANGVRPAEPGEFTLRAFLAGRIDLVQAEAVLGVIDAPGTESLTVALRQLAGGLSGRMAAVRGDLIDLLADLEAGLDFVEDGIEFVARDEVLRRIVQAHVDVERVLDQCETRAQTAGRRRIALAGLPNAGKSTLFNALLSRDAALVSPKAGTTRDYLRGLLTWQNVAVELIDTPGWEAPRADLETSAILEENPSQQAQKLGAEQWQQADLIVWCSPANANERERLEEERIRTTLPQHGRPLIVVETKLDLHHAPRERVPSPTADVGVSAITGIGLTELIAKCIEGLNTHAAANGEIIGSTAARSRDSLIGCLAALRRAESTARSKAGDEIVALELREALDHLGRVLGTIYTDDILGRIFSRFCIGK